MEDSALNRYIDIAVGMSQRKGMEYSGYLHLLKEHGEYFGEKDIQNSHKVDKSYHKAKACFYNCQELTINQWGKWKYYEGISLNVIPVLHAWLKHVPTGKIYDPTWHHNDLMAEQPEYIGVEIEKDIIELSNRHGLTGHSVIDAWDVEPRYWFLRTPYNSNIKKYEKCLKKQNH